MGTDISGGNYSQFNFNFNTGQAANEATGTEGSQNAANFNLLTEGTDTIGNFAFTALQFAFNSVYNASPQSPTLKQPDTDPQPDTPPYGATEQKMVKQFFSDQVTAQLNQLVQNQELSPKESKAIYNSILNGTTLSNPILAVLASVIEKNVTQETINQGNLPQSWSLSSTNAKDWTPLPIPPYGADQQGEINNKYDQTLMNKGVAYLEQHLADLTPEQAVNLMTAIGTGLVSSDVADIYIQISQEARTETQESAGLSSTWFRGTTNTDDWTPINTGIITPTKVAQAKTAELLNNINQVMTDVNGAAEKLLKNASSSASDPTRLALADFLKVIGDAIRNLKATLQQLQVKDAQKSQDNSSAKFDELKDRRVRASEQDTKMEDMHKKQNQMKTMGLSMKIVGPILAALATIVGAIIAIASLGTLTALGVALIAAGITVGVGMTAYTVADSVTGCTQKLVQAFTKALEKMMPDASPVARSAVKALIIAAMVAVLAVVVGVAMITGGGEGAAANIATQAVAQTVRETIIEVVKQMAIQAMVMIIMSSNALPELVGNILKANNVDKKGQAIAQAIIMAVTLLAVMVGASKMMGSSGASNIDETVNSAAQNAGNITKTASERFKDMLKNIQETADSLIGKIKDLPTNLATLPGQIRAGAVAQFKALQTQLGTLLNDLKNSTITQLNSLQTTLGKLPGEIRSGFNAQIKAIKDMMGDIQKTISTLMDDIKNLPSTLPNLPGQIKESISSQLKSLQSNLNNLLNDVNVSTTKQLKALQDNLIALPGKLKANTVAQLQVLKSMIGEIQGAANLLIDKVKDFLGNLKNLPGDIKDNAIAQLKALKDLTTFQVINGVARTAPAAAQVVGGCINGSMNMRVHDLLLQVGDLQSAEDMLTALIAALEKLLKNIQTGMDDRGNFIQQLQQVFSHIYNSASQAYGKVFQTLQG